MESFLTFYFFSSLILSFFLVLKVCLTSDLLIQYLDKYSLRSNWVWDFWWPFHKISPWRCQIFLSLLWTSSMQQGHTLSLSIFRMYMKTRNFNVKLVIRTIRQRPDYIFINKMYITQVFSYVVHKKKKLGHQVGPPPSRQYVAT